MLRKDESGVYRCSGFEEFGWLVHGFGTRHSQQWPGGGWVASLKQVHSNRSRVATAASRCLGEGDALITTTPGQTVVVRTADCFPLLIIAPEAKVVAAVHAGWRGTATNIAAATVERLCGEFGARPREIRVAIGPGIGPCCYEVGPEVLARFREFLPRGSNLTGEGMLDLAAVNRRQLALCGVPTSQIFSGAPCTSCHPEDFFSYRREPGERSRMDSAIGIRA